MQSLNKDKIKALKESIKLHETIMVESQKQIRQAQDVLEHMQNQYKRAMEDKIVLQDKLVAELEK